MHDMGYNRRLIEWQRQRFAGYQPPPNDQAILLGCLQQICGALAAPGETIADVQPHPYAGSVQPMEQPAFAGDHSAPAFVSAASRADPSRATAWLYPGVLPLGALTLLTGQPKMGKSTIAVAMSAVVSAGGTWPTGEDCAPGGVILIEAEDSFADTQLRLMAAGADLRRIMVRDREAGPLDLSTPEGMAAIDGQASAMGGVRLLVLSPLLSFFGKSVGGDDTAIRGRLAPMLQWAAYNRVAVLGLMHPAKNAGRDLEAQFAGADGYRRAARSAFVAMRDPSDGDPVEKRRRRVLVCAGVNGASDDFRLFYRIEGAEAADQQTSRVVWLAGCDDDAAQLGDDDDDDDGGGGRLDRTVGALCRLLPIGSSRPAPEIKRAMYAEGFSKGAIDRAADALGVRREDGLGRAKLWSR